MGAGNGAVLAGVKEGQTNVGLPDLGCQGSFLGACGWGARKSEEKWGELRVKDKKAA